MNKIIARALSRTRRHAPTHAQVCTHIRAPAPANAYLHTPALPHAHPRTRQRMRAHTRLYTHAHTNARLHMLHIHSNTRTCTLLRTCPCSLTRTHGYPLVHMSYARCLHAHTNSHPHMRQHVRTQPAHVYVHPTYARMQLSASLYSSHAPMKCKSMHFCMSAFMRMIDFTC